MRKETALTANNVHTGKRLRTTMAVQGKQDRTSGTRSCRNMHAKSASRSEIDIGVR